MTEEDIDELAYKIVAAIVEFADDVQSDEHEREIMPTFRDAVLRSTIMVSNLLNEVIGDT